MVGLGLAIVDYVVNRCRSAKKVRICRIEAEGAYQKGVEHGKKFRSEIHKIYYQMIIPWIYQQENKKVIDERLGQLDLSDDLKQELSGLAQGANIPYHDVLLVNTFLDILPDAVACTCVAKKVDDCGQVKAFGIDNDSPSDLPSCPADPVWEKQIQEWYRESRRGHRIAKAAIGENGSVHRALKEVGDDRTVHSIVFRLKEKAIDLAIGEGFAADAPFARLEQDHLLEKNGKSA